VRPIEHREVPSIHGIELVRKHPSCFRGKAEAFEDLVVAIIEIALRRTNAPASDNWHCTTTIVEKWQTERHSRLA
jgi:hypothetical protein